MADRYCLYVDCRHCGYEIPFKEIPEPTPDDPAMAPEGATLKCPSCEREAEYSRDDMAVGVMDPED